MNIDGMNSINPIYEKLSLFFSYYQLCDINLSKQSVSDEFKTCDNGQAVSSGSA